MFDPRRSWFAQEREAPRGGLGILDLRRVQAEGVGQDLDLRLPDPALAFQAARPDRRALGTIRNAELDPDEMPMLRQAARLPRLPSGEDHRLAAGAEGFQQTTALVGAAGAEEGIDVPQVDRRVLQQRLPDGEPDRLLDLLMAAAGQPGRVQDQQADAERTADGLGGASLAEAIGAIEEKERRLPARLQGLGDSLQPARDRRRRGQLVGSGRDLCGLHRPGGPDAKGVEAQQVVRDARIDPQGLAEGGRAAAGLFGQEDQAVAQQRRGPREARPPRELFLEGPTEEIEHQVHAWALLGDIVLKEGVDALVTQVELGREADQQGIQVEGAQLEQLRQPEKAQPLDGLRDLVLACPDARRQPVEGIVHVDVAPRDAGPARQAGGRLHQCGDVLLGDVQALESNVGLVDLTCTLNLRLN